MKTRQGLVGDSSFCNHGILWVVTKKRRAPFERSQALPNRLSARGRKTVAKPLPIHASYCPRPTRHRITRLTQANETPAAIRGTHLSLETCLVTRQYKYMGVICSRLIRQAHGPKQKDVIQGDARNRKASLGHRTFLAIPVHPCDCKRRRRLLGLLCDCSTRHGGYSSTVYSPNPRGRPARNSVGL